MSYLEFQNFVQPILEDKQLQDRIKPLEDKQLQELYKKYTVISFFSFLSASVLRIDPNWPPIFPHVWGPNVDNVDVEILRFVLLKICVWKTWSCKLLLCLPRKGVQIFLKIEHLLKNIRSRWARPKFVSIFIPIVGCDCLTFFFNFFRNFFPLNKKYISFLKTFIASNKALKTF